MGVRKPSNRGKNIIGYHSAIKTGKMEAYESTLECDFLFTLDFDPLVKNYYTQPLTIEYQHMGKRYKYTPDVLAESDYQPTLLVECKPQRLVKREINIRKFNAANDYCLERGWQFKVVTEQEIRQGFRLKNIKMLARYARSELDSAVRDLIWETLLTADSPPTVLELATNAIPDNLNMGIVQIYRMIFNHELCVELDENLVSVNSSVLLEIR